MNDEGLICHCGKPGRLQSLLCYTGVYCDECYKNAWDELNGLDDDRSERYSKIIEEIAEILEIKDWVMSDIVEKIKEAKEKLINDHKLEIKFLTS